MKQVNDFYYEAPRFEPERWRGCVEASCYAYALNVRVNKLVLIGDFIGRRCTSDTSDGELDEVLMEELECIFDYEAEEITDEKERLKAGQRRIFIEKSVHTGFYHMFREDEGGIWSHKMPGGLPQRVDRIALLNRLASGCTTVKCYLLTRKGLA